MKPKVIAFYLPQFHPMPENDEWWGPGFTEWTNVAKARPLYRGHVQPHLPAHLGFYDLRFSESRVAQSQLAREAGIYGFCYWHYWFNGKRIMNRPFDEVVKSGDPDFPFCLAWANHSWHKKSWTAGNKMDPTKSEMLIEQTYGGVEDYTNHFYALLDAFRDHRYVKVNGKLLFMIYNALEFDDFSTFSTTWQSLAEKEDLPGFYFVTHACIEPQIVKIDDFLAQGYDAVNVSLHFRPFKENRLKKHNYFGRVIRKIRSTFRLRPDIVEYKAALKWMDNEIFDRPHIIPTIIPNWDHTPRSGVFGRVLQNSTPELFREHMRMVFKHLNDTSEEKSIVFLKSWNEWGEGNYIEPDIEFGNKRLEALKAEIEEFAFIK